MSEIDDHPPMMAPNGGAPSALHRSVADGLRRQLAEGKLAPGHKLPPLREIAAEFDVSTMTVRLAVQRLEEEGLVYKIPSVGVFVSQAPPRKAIGQKVLAFLAIDVASSFPMAIALGIGKVCQEHGWALQILDAHFDTQREAQNILNLPDSGARGAIILPPWSAEDADTVHQLHDAGFPIVLVDRTRPGLNADLVESDHEGGAYRCANHLIDHGHTRIIMLTHPPGLSSITARIHGYERALREAGIRAEPEWMAWIDQKIQYKGTRQNQKWLGGYTAIMPVLKNVKPPVAIFAIDPPAAWGVYEACRDLELRIPEDVSIIGFDDSEIAHTMRPPMTIVAQRTDDIARAAVETLEQRLKAEHLDTDHCRTFRHIVVGVDLIERQSVATVPEE
jgi:DNA-binding LacI/PurR family transcriptional regulator